MLEARTTTRHDLCDSATIAPPRWLGRITPRGRARVPRSWVADGASFVRYGTSFELPIMTALRRLAWVTLYGVAYDPSRENSQTLHVHARR